MTTEIDEECESLVTLKIRLTTPRFQGEVKRTSSPRMTPSMRSALDDLKLKRLDVIHAGEKTFPLDKKVRAVALVRLLDDLKSLS